MHIQYSSEGACVMKASPLNSVVKEVSIRALDNKTHTQ
jgi:hypothetical protein